ncbi:MAG: hypothetical protein ACMUHY_06005 [Thermoplasmatota archaeon]
MADTLETVRTVLLLIFSISAVAWGLFGFGYRFYISKRDRIGYLHVEMPVIYQMLFWFIVIPLFILFTWNMLA